MERSTVRPSQKLLLIRFSSIGDIVLTTPVLRCLKQQLDVEVHFLTKQKFAGILADNPYLDKLITIKKEVTEVLPLLRAERYDQVIDLHHNLRTFRLRLALKRPWRQFDKINWKKWARVNLKLDLLPDKHIVDRYMETIIPLGVTYDGAGLDHFIPAEEREVAGMFLKKYGLASGKFVAFAIGAAHATKRLPINKIIAVCKELDREVVLLGGPAEQHIGEEVAARFPASVISACGQVSIQQSAALIERSAVLITHDTGMMHIGAALRRPMISVWGNTIPAFGMYPFYPQGGERYEIMEVKGLPCRPCSKIGYAKCPKGHFKCMREQDTGSIVKHAIRFIREGTEPANK